MSVHISVDAALALRKNLLNIFLLCGQLHCCLKEPFLKVAKKLHLVMHVIVPGHERRLSSSAKPVDQLAADVWKPGECLEVISLTFGEVFKHLGVFISAMGTDVVLPFSQADLLKTLFKQWKQCRTIVLLVDRPAQNNLRLKVEKHLHEKNEG